MNRTDKLAAVLMAALAVVIWPDKSFSDGNECCNGQEAHNEAQCTQNFSGCGDFDNQVSCGNAYDSVQSYPIDCRAPEPEDNRANCVDVEEPCLRKIKCKWAVPLGGLRKKCILDEAQTNGSGEEIWTTQIVKGDPGCLEPNLPNGQPNTECAPPLGENPDGDGEPGGGGNPPAGTP